MRVFVSYAQRDRAWAEELISLLKAKGVKVWDPSSELVSGDNWPLAIGKALEEARAMIVLVSPAAAESLSVSREVEYALGSKKFRDRLIPVVVEPTEKMPWILRRLQWLEGSPREVSERIVKRRKAGGISVN